MAHPRTGTPSCATSATHAHRVVGDGGAEDALSAALEEALARCVVGGGWDLLELQRERATLEDVFRSLTLRAQQEALHA